MVQDYKTLQTIATSQWRHTDDYCPECACGGRRPMRGGYNGRPDVGLLAAPRGGDVSPGRLRAAGLERRHDAGHPC
jgi:hypothetical protein